MKNFLKYVAALAIVGAFFVACSDWTDPEREITQHPDQQSPILRDNAYYQALREYKKTKHKIAFGWYGSWTAVGASYQTRLQSAPDSMDIISIWSQWHSLTPEQIADKEFVQKIKGTKVTFTIFSDKMPEPFLTEIGGGEYTDECRNRRHFVGLRRALAYYVWARLVKTSVNHLTRFGFVQKRDEYSQATEYRERQTAYNDAFAIADGYMKECLAYIQAKPEIFADYTLKGKVKANRTKFKILGN